MVLVHAVTNLISENSSVNLSKNIHSLAKVFLLKTTKSQRVATSSAPTHIDAAHLHFALIVGLRHEDIQRASDRHYMREANIRCCESVANLP